MLKCNHAHTTETVFLNSLLFFSRCCTFKKTVKRREEKREKKTNECNNRLQANYGYLHEYAFMHFIEHVPWSLSSAYLPFT